MAGLFTKNDTYTVTSLARLNGVIIIKTASNQNIYFNKTPFVIQQNNGSRRIDAFIENQEIELVFQSDSDMENFFHLTNLKRKEGQ